MSSWDNARRHARALESALDTKLAAYSRLAAEIAGGGKFNDGEGSSEDGVGRYKLVEEEVEELLGKVGVLWLLTPARSRNNRPHGADQLAVPAAEREHAARGAAAQGEL